MDLFQLTVQYTKQIWWTPETITKFEKAMIDLKKEHPDLLDKALFGATEYVPVNHFEHLQTLIDALDVTKIPHM